MKILIIVATKKEVEPLLSKLGLFDVSTDSFIKFDYNEIEIAITIAGVGMVKTAMKTRHLLLTTGYDMMLNVGICGSFNKNLEIGTVVNIVEDCFSELGAEDGDEFLSLEEMGLERDTKVLLSDSETQIDNYVIDLLPKVNGITVNTVHGNERSIDKVVSRFHPMVESMEGAAFMLACKGFAMPYAQIRAVSNFVERRNKDNWNIPLAIENLNKKMLEILDAF